METYEYIDNDLEFRFYAEQVSHHPAISACYVEGNGYNFSTNSHSKSNFLLTKGALEFQNLQIASPKPYLRSGVFALTSTIGANFEK